MGCCSCKSAQTQPQVKTPEGAAGAAYSQHPHILICGPSGSGKTTLLYRLVIPEWFDITEKVEPSDGFHYEEIKRGGVTLGLWDVSGKDAMRECWPCFYRYVKMWAILYVVNLLESRAEEVADSRSRIRSLVSDDCLRDTCLVVVMNNFDMQASSAPAVAHEMAGRLGLRELVNTAEDKVIYFVVNVKHGERDPEMQKALQFMLNHFGKVSAGRVAN